jgi:hypothetical protein
MPMPHATVASAHLLMRMFADLNRLQLVRSLLHLIILFAGLARIIYDCFYQTTLHDLIKRTNIFSFTSDLIPMCNEQIHPPYRRHSGNLLGKQGNISAYQVSLTKTPINKIYVYSMYQLQNVTRKKNKTEHTKHKLDATSHRLPELISPT